MSEVIVDRVGKSYREYRSELHRIARWFGLKVKPAAEHWVLRDVSFRVGSGEAVGIVGQNGAGKSTLLKMLTGTLKPTEGRFHVTGRIAAILELGMGFNPALTGRQNAYQSAGLMGFSGTRVDRVIDDIEAFAEIGEYFDQPVRVYSSGMQVRVAFAVATAFRPDILIVDEALSVGDAYFQHKSFDRIRRFREQGTTLLLVSHDRSAIQSVCDRAIYLEHGAIAQDGPPEQVMDYYNARMAEKEGSTVEQTTLADGRVRTRSGTGEATLVDITLHDSQGNPVEVVPVGAQVTLRACVQIHQPLQSLVFGYGIKDRLGTILFGTNTWHTGQILQDLPAGRTIEYAVHLTANLGVGHYAVQTALVDRDTHLGANYDWQDIALMFEVVNVDKPQFIGTQWIPPSIDIHPAK